ncbi:Uncharacterised protein [Escherichia coli]|nr:Uncharacterised protein [Escherichia coli]
MQRTRLLNQVANLLASQRAASDANQSNGVGHETEHHPVPDRVAACPADQVLTIDAWDQS